MSIRTPWAVMKGDIENHFHDVDNGVCKSTETHEYVRNLDALVRARGSKAAFLTLHPEDRAQCVEVAPEELCALGAFRDAGGSDESWELGLFGLRPKGRLGAEARRVEAGAHLRDEHREHAGLR